MKARPRAILLEALADLSDQFPQRRFGQLVANIAGWADVDVWDIEDDQMQAAIRDFLKSQAEKAKHTASPLSACVIAEITPGNDA